MLLWSAVSHCSRRPSRPWAENLVNVGAQSVHISTSAFPMNMKKRKSSNDVRRLIYKLLILY